MKKDFLHFQGELDVLSYYCKIAPSLEEYLKNKTLATKIHLKDFFFLKRGSNTKQIYIKNLKDVDEDMLSIRKNHLKDVKNKLNEKQKLIWRYFVPRKLVQLFYATNSENTGNPIERIFIDIDRKKHSVEETQIAALTLLQEIKNDEQFNSMLKYRIVILWTGASFHIILLLKKNIDIGFYNEYLSYGIKKEKSFITKWAEKITKKTSIQVSADHEKSDKFIILDSSNTPPGKLARAPFSLHVNDWKTWDGISVPISEDELKDKNLIKKLQKLTPEKVLKNIEKYKRLL